MLARTLQSLFVPHQTNSYKPHLIRRHGLALSLAVVFSIQIVAGLQTRSESVLGVASNISVSGLLSETNAERVASGFVPFRDNSKLNSAAQAKAQHMIANDYWSHTAPDGTSPWYFFDNAGYSYIAAGENLAYGFDTSAEVLDGWMNSSGHKANILHASYEEVGFGIANGDDYQGGPNTVVVAHYGDPVAAVKAKKSTPQPAPTVTSSTPSSPVTEATQADAKAPKKKDVMDTEPIAANNEDEPTNETTYTPATLLEQNVAQQERISNVQALLRGDAHWSLYATTMVVLILASVYAYRHLLFIHNIVVRGEKFVTHHPLLEASLIYATLWLLLNGTHGVIY